jgi:hypothetical protein
MIPKYMDKENNDFRTLKPLLMEIKTMKDFREVL